MSAPAIPNESKKRKAEDDPVGAHDELAPDGGATTTAAGTVTLASGGADPATGTAANGKSEQTLETNSGIDRFTDETHVNRCNLFQ